MFENLDIWLFLSASLALIVVPGPAVLYVVARGVQWGPKAGILSSAGIATGGLLHIAAASLGVTAILKTSPVAFGILKLLGSAYLIYLGISTLLQKSGHPSKTTPTKATGHLRRVFWDGFVVQGLNPTVALFFMAFLPQFVKADGSSPMVEIGLLGFLFVGLAFFIDVTYGILAGKVGAHFFRNPRVAQWQKWICGLTYLALGLLTLFGGDALQNLA